MSVENVAFSSKLGIFLFIAQERKAISKTGMYFPKKENVVCFLIFFLFDYFKFRSEKIQKCYIGFDTV